MTQAFGKFLLILSSSSYSCRTQSHSLPLFSLSLLLSLFPSLSLPLFPFLFLPLLPSTFSLNLYLFTFLCSLVSKSFEVSLLFSLPSISWFAFFSLYLHFFSLCLILLPISCLSAQDLFFSLPLSPRLPCFSFVTLKKLSWARICLLHQFSSDPSWFGINYSFKFVLKMSLMSSNTERSRMESGHALTLGVLDRQRLIEWLVV